jgi:hypothetical protein
MSAGIYSEFLNDAANLAGVLTFVGVIAAYLWQRMRRQKKE